MPKADLIRRIDHKPASPSANMGIGVYPSLTGSGTGHVGPYCVGRTEGARICLSTAVGNRPGVEFFVRDTANVPFISFSVVDGTPNSKELHIGYAEKKGIRFAAHTLGTGDYEEHPHLEIDAECLVGEIPSSVTYEGGASGTFTTTDGKTVTVANGFVTSIV